MCVCGVSGSPAVETGLGFVCVCLWLGSQALCSRDGAVGSLARVCPAHPGAHSPPGPQWHAQSPQKREWTGRDGGAQHNSCLLHPLSVRLWRRVRKCGQVRHPRDSRKVLDVGKSLRRVCLSFLPTHAGKLLTWVRDETRRAVRKEQKVQDSWHPVSSSHQTAWKVRNDGRGSRSHLMP